jgi:hypothetical protein
MSYPCGHESIGHNDGKCCAVCELADKNAELVIALAAAQAERDKAEDWRRDAEAEVIRLSMALRAAQADVLRLREAAKRAADQLKRGEWSSHVSGTWQILTAARSPTDTGAKK